MNKNVAIGIVLCVAAVCTLQAQQQYKLVWQDEFTNNGLPDTLKWQYDVGGHGWGNNEKQIYTNANATNCKQENGCLVITAALNSDSSITSARIKTKLAWQYGKIEVRAKLPKGIGTWPAIWMLPLQRTKGWPTDGEIDIMEHVGFNQNTIHATIHCSDYNHMKKTEITAKQLLPTATDSFHVYTVEWTPNDICISIDKTTYYNYNNAKNTYNSWPFNQPFQLLLNLAIGGNWGGQKGIDYKLFPAKFYIDYVKVYQLQ
jgi:beta-glucanase (GH16 family)